MKKIAITMGEPGGISPEVIVKALFCAEIRDFCNPVVVGNAETMKETVVSTGLPLEVRTLFSLKDSEPLVGRIEVVDIGHGEHFKRNAPSAEAGRAVVSYIKKAVELALQKQVSAVVTAPISKESLKMAGFSWPGHTELLAELTGARDFSMMFVSKKLRVILCTTHIALRDVPGNISEDVVYRTIEMAEKGAGMLGVRNPHIAVAGLNPHAGESGIFGNEDSQAIVPAIRKAQEKGINVSGPYPPDIIFNKAYRGDFDIVVSMYHDQGLIPFKMIAFDTGVNMTVGLPIVRTSPDHGTAFDISRKNIASPSSMLEAIKLASKIKLRVKK